MNTSRIAFHWRDNFNSQFRTGVSLHGHTLHSRESLDFIDAATSNVPWLSRKIRREKAKYRASKGQELDLRNVWWTPPLSPRQAWRLETTQIQQALGKAALVSLSDHDSIDGCVNLLVMEETRSCPVSIEWTVPFRRTFFHLGVHNLPSQTAVGMTRVMNEFTAAPREDQIAPILEWLGAASETLIILNHPIWDESHIGEAAHMECLDEFLAQYSDLIHALELNGLRSWAENLKASEFAKSRGMPVVSGGDRHGREPNACINLTNASSFAEFAAEIRCGAASNVFFLPQYREPLKMRIVENIIDILDDDLDHAMGWNHWTNRVFYKNEEGAILSLSDLWGDNLPCIVRNFASVMKFAKYGGVRSALRVALNERQEFAL